MKNVYAVLEWEPFWNANHFMWSMDEEHIKIVESCNIEGKNAYQLKKEVTRNKCSFCYHVLGVQFKVDILVDLDFWR